MLTCTKPDVIEDFARDILGMQGPNLVKKLDSIIDISTERKGEISRNNADRARSISEAQDAKQKAIKEQEKPVVVKKAIEKEKPGSVVKVERIVDPEAYYTLEDNSTNETKDFMFEGSEIIIHKNGNFAIKPPGFRFAIQFNGKTLKNKSGKWESMQNASELETPIITKETIIKEGDGWSFETTADPSGVKFDRYVKSFKDERFPNIDIAVQFVPDTGKFSIIERSSNSVMTGSQDNRKDAYDYYNNQMEKHNIDEVKMKEAIKKAFKSQSEKKNNKRPELVAKKKPGMKNGFTYVELSNDEHVTWNFSRTGEPEMFTLEDTPVVVESIGYYKDEDMEYSIVQITDQLGRTSTTQPDGRPLHITHFVNKENKIKPFMTGEHAQNNPDLIGLPNYEKFEKEKGNFSVKRYPDKNAKKDPIPETSPEMVKKIIGEDPEPTVESTQGSTTTGTLFDETHGDTIVDEQTIDFGADDNFFNYMKKFIDDDMRVGEGAETDKFVLGTKTDDFFNMQSSFVEKMQNALLKSDFSSIKLIQIEQALEGFDEFNESRETAGSISHMSDGTSNIAMNWNRFHGTARKSEVFMHEMVHFLTRKAFAGSPETKNLFKAMRKEAIKAGADYTIFLQDVNSAGGLKGTELDANGNLVPVYHSADIEIAKQKFQYVFGENADPEEFFTYAATNEAVYSFIKNLNVTPQFVSYFESENGEPVGRFKDFINRMLGIINTVWIAMSQSPKNGGEIVTHTMMKLIDMQSEMEENTKYENILKDDSLSNFTNKIDKKLLKWTTQFDEGIEKLNTKATQNGTIRNFTKKLEKVIVIGDIIKSNFFQNIWTTITEKTDNQKWAHLYELFRQGKDHTEKNSKRVKDSVKAFVNNMLGEDVDEATRRAITSIIFQLDLPSLESSSGIDMDKIKNLLVDENQLDRAYEAAYNNIKSSYTLANDRHDYGKRYGSRQNEFDRDMEQMLNLSSYLNDGKIVMGNQQFNAENIYNKFYDNSIDRDVFDMEPNQADKQIISNMNKFITLAALKKANVQDKKIMHEYMSTGSGLGNINKLMNMYKEYVNDSIDEFKISAFNGIRKGFMESPNNDNMKFDVVAADELKHYTGFMGNMKEIGVHSVINGVTYYKVAGRSHELGYDEGMFSIAGQGIPGVSLKSILTNQIRSKDKKENNKKNRMSSASVDLAVSQQIDLLANNGGVGDFIDLRSRQNMVPEYDILGKIIDYKIQLDKTEQLESMKLDGDIAESAAYTFMKLKHREAAINNNRKVVDTLMKYATDHVQENPDDFVTIKRHTEGKFDEDIHGRWNRIPDYTRNYIFERTGKHEITLPKNKLHMITGEREVSASNAFFLKDKKKTQKVILAIEGYIREILGYMKETIAIRTGGVVAANTMSNMIQAWLYAGIDPIEYIKRSRKHWVELNEYLEIQRKVDDLEAAKTAYTGSQRDKIQQEINILQAQLEKNGFHALVVDGQFSPIIEDVNIDENYGGHIANFINEAFKTNKMTEGMGKVKEQLFMDRNTESYKFMLKVTQYGDVITRRMLEEKILADAIAKGKPLSKAQHQDLLNKLDQMFVNYGYTDNRFLRYFERLWAVFFTKFLFRQGKAAYDVATQAPSKFLGLVGAEKLTGIDLASADDDYWHFMQSVLNRMSLDTPTDMGISVASPSLVYNFIPAWGDMYS